MRTRQPNPQAPSRKSISDGQADRTQTADEGADAESHRRTGQAVAYRPDQSGPMSRAKRPNLGKSRIAIATREKLFVEAYLSNGSNVTQAAIAVGYSPNGADVAGNRLLGKASVVALLAERTKKVLTDAGLSTERWAKEVACIAHANVADLFREDGTLIPIQELPEHVQRSLGFELGKDGVKLWSLDKNASLATVGKHLGAFEKDNAQKQEHIRVSILLV